MANNDHSLTLKGLFNITTIVLWTQSSNETNGPCHSPNNVTNTGCLPEGEKTAAAKAPDGVVEFLGDLGRHGAEMHDVINHGDTSYHHVSDNNLLNYENVISNVPLLNIITTHAPTTIPEITSIIQAVMANATESAVATTTNTTFATTTLSTTLVTPKELNNYWALLALILVIGTAAGNILVCLAITWERRLQNVTNYFLMSLAITDLMVAILVMPLGILTLFHGKCAVNIVCIEDMVFGSLKRLSPASEFHFLFLAPYFLISQPTSLINTTG